MNIKEGLLYTREHEWIAVDGDQGYVGITDYAQHQLGDIVFVEIPEIDLRINLGESIAVIESVKAAATVFSPVTGTVIKINEELEESPELLNEEPYENYIAVLSINDKNELIQLMNASDYASFCRVLEEEGEEK